MGAEFLFESLEEKLPIGWYFLDLIYGFAKNFMWNTSHFSRFLRVILNISIDYVQVLMAFVKHDRIKILQEAIKEVTI